MPNRILKKYFRFIWNNGPLYFNFSKQLLIAELAGFGAGIGMAEAIASRNDNSITALFSGLADYAGSLIGFLVTFYRDGRLRYRGLSNKERVAQTIRDTFPLWPTFAFGDISYVIARPYIHYLLLSAGSEAGIAATIAHFAAFGIFNGVALLSRSLIDFQRSGRQ